MPLRVAFAEQSTGIATTPTGQWSLGGASYQRADTMWDALEIARTYLDLHPTHEALIGSSVAAHRIVPPSGKGFDTWISDFRQSQSVGPIALGMSYGEIVSLLGWPDNASAQLRRSPMAVILRYEPKDIDFHFDDGGRLCLIHQDDPDDPLTILKP